MDATQNTQPDLDRVRQLEDMIDNPEKYGFSWGWGHLEHKGLRVTTGRGAPHIQHRDLDLLRKTFGDDYFLRSSDGQSARVRDQTIRMELTDDIRMRSNERAMQRWILEKAFGAKRPRKVTVVEKIVEKRIYVADDGMEFEDKAEFMAHQIDIRQAAE